jgi:hypothetical protein
VQARSREAVPWGRESGYFRHLLTSVMELGRRERWPTVLRTVRTENSVQNFQVQTFSARASSTLVLSLTLCASTNSAQLQASAAQHWKRV